ncbi:MAG: hypothetical protein WBD22_11300 [Pyrinomonadaceae bacterium]
MKRCPECRRDYTDDTLSFCLDDGASLVDGPATRESATAILSSAEVVDESPTAILPKPYATSEGSPHTAAPSSAEFLIGEIKRRKTLVGFAVLTILLVIGGAGFALFKFGLPDNSQTALPFQAMKIERLTSNGKATQAVISPDGKQVVYVVDDAGKRSLWLRQVATATDVQLTPPTNEVFYWSLTISPDGNFLYYIYGGTIRNRMLYQMPLVGGSPKKLVDDISSPIGFSPDGKQIAFVRIRQGESQQGESSMMIANADGTGEREIAKRPGQQSLGTLFWGGVAWTPDGAKIVTAANNRDDAGPFKNIVEITIADGTIRPLTSHKFYEIQRLAMLADGSGLLVTAAEKASEFRSRQIWYLPYTGGEARKITHDLNDYTSISMTADSNVLVTVQEDSVANIWIAPNGDSERAIQISSVSGKMDGYDGVAWTPYGRIVYTSMAGGTVAIWIMDGDGKNRKQLSAGEGADFSPSVSTDGRYIVFISERGSQRSVWRMGVDGSNPKQLTGGGGGNTQATAEWVFFGGVLKVPIDGGERLRVTEERVNRCAISPDEKLLACQHDPPDGSQARIKVISVDDGAVVKDFTAKMELPARIRWSPDGRSITYISRTEGLRDIWSQPFEGGEPKKITKFKADQIFSFNWSSDNKLVISHGTSTSDVVLIRNTK